MSELIHIEYRDKNGDVYETCSRYFVPSTGSFIQLHSGIYPVMEVIWMEERQQRVVVVIGNKTKKAKIVTENYGNW